jgi:hypothetical protein
MNLIALPAELTINIAELLDPDSTLNLALTCKHHQALCKPVLAEHGRLFSEWQLIDTTDAKTLLWQILIEILDNPRRGWYVRELNLPSDRQYNWNVGGSLFPPHPQADNRPSGREKTMLKKAAQSLRSLYPIVAPDHILVQDPPYSVHCAHDLIGTIENRIDDGVEDGVLAILLHYLPYLMIFRLTEVDDSSQCLELLMRRIADGYRVSIRLTTSAIEHTDTEPFTFFRILS